MDGTIRLALWTREEVAKRAADTVVVLPVGAIEQHGPHLPLGVDSLVVDTIAVRSCEEASDAAKVCVAPTLAFGNSHHHFPFPALSLSSETLLLALKDLVRSLAVCGFRKIFVLNGHGGNDEMIRAAARDMTRECGISIAAASYWTIAWEAFAAETGSHGIGRVPGHAGGFETALMLAVAPEQVRVNRLPPQRDGAEPVPPRTEMARSLFVQHPGKQTGTDGYTDGATRATEELGQRCMRVAVREVAAALRQFADS